MVKRPNTKNRSKNALKQANVRENKIRIDTREWRLRIFFFCKSWCKNNSQYYNYTKYKIKQTTWSIYPGHTVVNT